MTFFPLSLCLLLTILANVVSDHNFSIKDSKSSASSQTGHRSSYHYHDLTSIWVIVQLIQRLFRTNLFIRRICLSLPGLTVMNCVIACNTYRFNIMSRIWGYNAEICVRIIREWRMSPSHFSFHHYSVPHVIPVRLPLSDKRCWRVEERGTKSKMS